MRGHGFVAEHLERGAAKGEHNAAAQRDDSDSVFAHYRRLIALRHTVPVVALGDFTLLLPDDEQVYAFTRSYQGEELLVLANLSSRDADVTVLLYTERTVKANYAFEKGKLDDKAIETIVKDVSKITPAK